MARVIFINRFYAPEEPATAQLLGDLAEGLAALGHDVHVITSLPASGVAPLRETLRGVQVHRIRGTRWGKHFLPGRAVDFATFLAGIRRVVRQLATPGSFVVAKTDPPLLGAWIERWLRKRPVKVIHWVQDVYPEIATELAASPLLGTPLRLLRPWRNAAWRRAAGCVVLGESMATLVREACGNTAPPLTIIPNWSPRGLHAPSADEVADQRAAWGLQPNEFAIGYSGNLGRVHNLEPIVQLATYLRQHANLRWIFIGGGGQRAIVEREFAERHLLNVLFLPPQPREKLSASLGALDLHLATVRTNCANLVFPSKCYGVAAVGRPLLFFGPPQSDPAQLVTTSGFGAAFSEETIAEAADFVTQLQADPARRVAMAAAGLHYTAHHGDARFALPVWDQLLRGT